LKRIRILNLAGLYLIHHRDLCVLYYYTYKYKNNNNGIYYDKVTNTRRGIIYYSYWTTIIVMRGGGPAAADTDLFFVQYKINACFAGDAMRILHPDKLMGATRLVILLSSSHYDDTAKPSKNSLAADSPNIIFQPTSSVQVSIISSFKSHIIQYNESGGGDEEEHKLYRGSYCLYRRYLYLICTVYNIIII